jgi:hypothetical protein
MAFTTYTDARVDIGTKSNVQNAQSVSTDFRSNHQLVKTLAKGNAGVSKGFSSLQIVVTMALPADAPEVDIYPEAVEGERVAIKVYRSGQVLATFGLVSSISEQKNTDAAATQTITLDCDAVEWASL